MIHILLIEDDQSLRHTLQQRLQLEGYKVVTAISVSEASKILQVAMERKALPSLVLLDLGLPDGDGAAVLRMLRKTYLTPVIVISAAGTEDKKVSLLDMGADDFLVKPFGQAELLARIRTSLRHRGIAQEVVTTHYENGRVAIDLTQRWVKVDEQIVHLTPKEFDLLSVLVRAAGRVVTQRQLLIEVWGVEFLEHTHYLRLFTAQIRRKIEVNPAEPQLLLTEAGVGYRLRVMD